MNLLKTLVLSSLLLMAFQSCKDRSYELRDANVPIYQKVGDWRNENITFQSPQTIEKSGKIYIYEDLLLIVEPFEGIHFFDNTNKSLPVNLGFLPILACSEISIKNDILYTNSYFDLLSFNISDVTNPVLVNRKEDAFEFTAYSNMPGYDSNYPMGMLKHPDRVIIGWEIKKAKVPTFQNNSNQETFDTAITMQSSESASGGGLGGSLARFTIVNDNLYVLQDHDLISYSITATNITETGKSTISQNAETIFPFEHYLFIGTTTGMLIYDIDNSNNPSFVSKIEHIYSCDPVAVIGDRAYVTLSTGTNCWGTNSLEVIDISDVYNPKTIKTYGLTHPQGLGVAGSYLFLCDDEAGFKIFDKNDDYQIVNNFVAGMPNVKGKDVIPFQNKLIIMATDGVYQYDYSDITNISLLSKIEINNN